MTITYALEQILVEAALVWVPIRLYVLPLINVTTPEYVTAERGCVLIRLNRTIPPATTEIRAPKGTLVNREYVPAGLNSLVLLQINAKILFATSRPEVAPLEIRPMEPPAMIIINALK